MAESLIDDYRPGEDITIDMLWEDALDNALLPSSLSDYKIEVVHEGDLKAVLKTFKRQIESAEDLLVVVDDDPAGKISIELDRAWSQTAKYGQYFIYTHKHYPDPSKLEGVRVEIEFNHAFNIIQ